MKIKYTIFFIAFFSLNCIGQTVTWQKQISCIIYTHCTNCHNPNGLAPTSFMGYTEVYNNRFGIMNAVVTKKMPPNLPDINYSHLANQKVLSESEITAIKEWVNNGAPSGDTSKALSPPIYSSKEEIVSPDLVGRMPKFTIPNTGADLYQAFIVSEPSNSVNFITEIEVVPGNRNVVHHVLVFQDTSMAPVNNDSAYAGPGYVAFGGIGSSSAKLVSAWVPGASTFKLPIGMGVKLDLGARLIIQIHYPNGSGGEIDSTKLNIKYTTTPLRNVSTAPVLNTGNLTNGPLFIQAGTTKTLNSQYTVPINLTAISVAPHAHLICKKFEVYGVTLSKDTIKFIKIDDWDFHWQGAHSFKQPIKIPAGTILYGKAFYDNTSNNPHNPSSPPKDVKQGEATTDEMMLIYFSYLNYQNGDENIIIDTTSHQAHYQNCEPALASGNETNSLNEKNVLIFPNPSSESFSIFIEGKKDFKVEIINTLGETLATYNDQEQIPVSELLNGIYFVKIKKEEYYLIKKILVQK